MGDAFPTTGIFRRGYGKDAVDEFFIDMKEGFRLNSSVLNRFVKRPSQGNAMAMTPKRWMRQ